MKITDITCTHVAIPKVSSNVIGGGVAYEGNPYRDEDPAHMAKFVDAVPHFGHSVSCIVKVFTDEGIVGLGEAGNDKRCDIERIKQNLIGADVFDVSYLSNFTMQGRGNTLRNFARNVDLPRTKEMSAIEFALWDCIGKKLGQPVYRLLGGKVRKRTPITLFLGERPIDECLRDIDRAVKQGIRTVKLKVGCNDRRDVDLFREVRRQFGDDLVVRIDPNAAWTVPEAIRMLKRMEKYNPQYVEGALRKTDCYGFRRIREATGVPVCICEEFNGYIEMTSEQALARVVELIRMKCCDVLSVDPSRTGGLLGFTKLCAVCEGAGLQVVTHRALTGPSQAAWLTGILLCRAANLAQDIVPIGHPSGAICDTVFETLPVVEGAMQPWDGPGWGMTLLGDVLKRYECVDRNLCGASSGLGDDKR